MFLFDVIIRNGKSEMVAFCTQQKSSPNENRANFSRISEGIFDQKDGLCIQWKSSGLLTELGFPRMMMGNVGAKFD